MAEATDLFSQQEQNRRRSAWLVAGFMLFAAWIGFGGDWALYELSRGAPPGARHVVPWIGIGVMAVAAAFCWWSWTQGADAVLRSTGAREIVAPSTAAEQQLVNVVEEMAIASGLPKPRIWVVPEADPNAFATGRDPATASIAVTEGLLATLSRDELQGVVAHELAHVRNYDVRLMTLLAAMVGTMAMLADFLGRGMQFGSFGGRSRDRDSDRDSGGGGLGLVLLVLWIISVILAPIVTQLIAMAVSRNRELLADASAAQFTRNPLALASALEKLEAAGEPTRAISRGAAHLCIVDPLGSALGLQEGFLADTLATHPPIRRRIAQLRAMAYQQAKQAV